VRFEQDSGMSKRVRVSLSGSSFKRDHKARSSEMFAETGFPAENKGNAIFSISNS
jgi:hypothetical protein